MCLLALVPIACEDDIDPVVEELSNSRAFAPVALEARIRNQVDIELSWRVDEGVSEYVVEFFQDSLRFSGDPIATATVNELPVAGSTITYTETFSGETRYSARVKAIVTGKEESKWATITAATDAEQIFNPVPLDVQGNFAVVSWAAGSDVTNFLVQPGNILIPISDAQKTVGEARIDGLQGATDYIVTLYNGVAKRGTIAFSTLKEANVTALDDLGAAIDAAADGATLVLEAGTYMLDSKVIAKSITLEGQNPLNMPVVIGQLACETAVASINLKNLHFKGEFNYGQFFNAAAATCNLGSLTIEDCEISEYSNNIIYNNSGGTYGDISIINTYIHDIEGGGGDGFDFRGGEVGSLTVENTTIANGIRTLLRMQVAADVVFENCTFYRTCIVASGNNRGFFRMSGGGNSLEVSNCLFVETGVDDNGTLRGVWSRDGDISDEVVTDFSNNYYSNVIGLFDGDGTGFTDPAQVDATEADPGFEDPENGDFTITNQLLIDEGVGDSRWWF